MASERRTIHPKWYVLQPPDPSAMEKAWRRNDYPAIFDTHNYMMRLKIDVATRWRRSLHLDAEQHDGVDGGQAAAQHCPGPCGDSC
eukprot:429640-Prymnesium_polylepis.1